MSTLYAEIIVPIARQSCYTYKVPDNMVAELKVGQRVIIELNKHLKSGVVLELHKRIPSYKTKTIYSIWDTDEVLIGVSQLKFWRWMASYYMCEIGEVMAAALPAAFRLDSESVISLQTENYVADDEERALLTKVQLGEKYSVSDLVGKDKKKLKVLNNLLGRKIVQQEVAHKQHFRPQKKKFLLPRTNISSQEWENLTVLQKKVLEELQKQIAEQPILKSDFLQREGITVSPLNALMKKGLIRCEERIVSRNIFHFSEKREELNSLSKEQKIAFDSIHEKFECFRTVLLHGVTASGKTELYMHLITEQLKKGENVLYLLPEIALTTQLAERLGRFFGKQVLVYHSKYNDNERFEVWQKIAKKDKPYLVIGARSAVFLPFASLGLIVVDEEHERSFKQQSPAPHYHGRDAAVFLAHLYSAKVLLGSGTPSLESYFNVHLKKYGLVELFTRYKGIRPPEITIADLSEPTRKKQMKGALTPMLYTAIKEVLEKGEQVILFQNRRGYAYFVKCKQCGEVPQCPNCDVSLSLHKHSQVLRCHYCDFQVAYNTYNCPSCNESEFVAIGLGTQKLEEQLQEQFPEYSIGRFDWDTTSGKYAYERLIHSFENKKIDILVGTQMLAKGLDFNNVGLVGVLNADMLLHFPDFRAFEHSFQLLLQVSGRAGRREKVGRVIIQSYKPEHPVLQLVKESNYKKLYHNLIRERHTFGYPPVFRMIKVVLKHKDYEHVRNTAIVLGNALKQVFGRRTYGATVPLVGRVSRYYIQEIILKIERKSSYEKAKSLLKKEIIKLQTDKQHRSVRISCVVDVH